MSWDFSLVLAQIKCLSHSKRSLNLSQSACDQDSDQLALSPNGWTIARILINTDRLLYTDTDITSQVCKLIMI